MWRCTKGYPCKARFKAAYTGEVIRVTTFQHTHPPPSIIINNGVLLKVPKDTLLYLYNQAGRPTALLYGYSYYYNGNRKKTDVWRCTKTSKCSASFVTTKDRKILRWNIAYFVHNINGKELAIVRGHSFYCGSRGAKTAIWRCTRWGQCRARFIMNVQGKVVTSHLEHNHRPPMFVIREVTCVQNPLGKPVAIFNGFTYYSSFRSKLVLSWRCTRGSPCKARISTTPEYKIIRGREVLIIDGYAFRLMRRHIATDYYWCAKGNKCTSKVVVSKGKEIVKANVKHNHAPMKYIISVSIFKNNMGKDVAVVDNFTYYCGSRSENTVSWRCSYSKCRSRFLMTYDHQMLRGTFEHKHDPPRDADTEQSWQANSYPKWFYILLCCYGYVHSRLEVYPREDLQGSILHWVYKSSGTKLAVIEGFTFYCAIKNKMTSAWRCTKGGNCKAKFTLHTDTQDIMRPDLRHDHSPPTFIIKDGVYLKI
ncbi:unnamed protein product [Danaus chrysippus]|uniref:(African queen) hypothetical protein n=1 Tax=Danaus chrysippus TaxID=151541 RepID=A0A8J2R7J4_9NEOP|nr:unnamed protein product [Danaus chrysippus]